MDLMSREGGESFIKGLLESVKLDMEKHGHINPIATLVVTLDLKGQPLKEGEVHIHHIPLGDSFEKEEKKQEASFLLRFMARRLGAVASVFISEAWVARGDKDLPPEEAKRRMENWISKHGSLKNYPGRGEIVMVSFEHKALAPQFWTALILRDEHKTTLGEFELQDAGITGRFFRILPALNMN